MASDFDTVHNRGEAPAMGAEQSAIPEGIPRVKSRDNPLVRRVRSLRHAKFRRSSGLYPAEGVRLLEDAVAAGVDLPVALVSPRLFRSPRGRSLARELAGRAERLAAVPDNLMAALHETRTHQGVVAIAARHDVPLEDLPPGATRSLVLAHRVQDPGNLGAIFRSTDASAADGVITTPETVDPFNPKTVRTAMGSLFRVPVAVAGSLELAAAFCRSRGMRIIAAHLEGTPFQQCDLSSPFALVMGREGEGLVAEDLATADLTVSIPMRQGADSLNVGAAAAVLLYEAARQRGYHFPPAPEGQP
jgi:TrmH family RNA methyltransferase